MIHDVIFRTYLLIVIIRVKVSKFTVYFYSKFSIVCILLYCYISIVIFFHGLKIFFRKTNLEAIFIPEQKLQFSSLVHNQKKKKDNT